MTNSGDSPTVRTAANTDVQNAVTVRVESLSEGAAVSVIADETVGTITAGDVIFDALANSSGVAEITDFNYEGAFDPSGLDVIVRARQQGIPNAAIQDDNGAFADETTAANSNTTNDINLLPATPVVNQDRYLFGHAEQFGGLKVSITTAGIVRARQQGIPNAAIQDDNGAFADETTAANSNTTGAICLATPSNSVV